MIDFILFNFGDIYSDNETFSIFQFLLNLFYEVIGGMLFVLIFNRLIIPTFAYFRVKKIAGNYYHFLDRNENSMPIAFPVNGQEKKCLSIIKTNFWKPYILTITGYDFNDGLERVWVEDMVLDSNTLLTATGSFIYTDNSEVGFHSYFIYNENTIQVKLILPNNQYYIYYFKRVAE